MIMDSTQNILLNQSQPIRIFLVEDNLGDVFLINNTLQESLANYQLDHVLNGVEAMKFLYQEGEYAEVSRPDLILLDLNLPLKHGLDVLQEIKLTSELKMIPVIILTSSTREQDILASYNSYASCYLSKPININDFINTIKSLEHFWLRLVQLPSRLEAQNN